MKSKWPLAISLAITMAFFSACTATDDSLKDGSDPDSGGGGGIAVPLAPTAITATAVSPTSVTLGWADNSVDETGFTIERKVSGKAFGKIGDAAANATSWSDSGLNPSTTYHYRVRAVSAAGKSQYSDEALVTTPAPAVSPPAAPTLLTATAASSTQVNLAWKDNAANESGFGLERKTGAGGTWSQIATPATNAASYSNSGLTASTTYYYRVRATNSAGNSTYSNEATATTPAAPPPPPVGGDPYVVFAYNDTGMNVMSSAYDTIMFAPPNNTLRAQVIKRGDPPQIVTSGVTVSYSVPGNTHSSDKVNFWTYAPQLLGRSLANDVGITGNGLSGNMVYAGSGYFHATGIPVTPKMDNGTQNAYPLAMVTVKTTSNNQVVATTQTPVPVSSEIRCASCHSLGSTLSLHPTNLTKPVFCGRCHTQYPLRSINAGSTSYPTLSRAIHVSHAGRTSSCFSCHPGQTDKYSRDVHFSAGLTCTSCHGNMSAVGGSARKPWQDEPKCTQCHNVAGHTYEQTGKLFKDSVGHYGVTCAACHGAPHAIGPSSVPADNTQALDLQGAAGVINQCTVCHVTPPGTFNHTY